jgi:N-acetyl-anhydromuramyl-L-alanine amidase AmpD
MRLTQLLTSPNFEATEIPVEFLVIHYTACNLADTLAIFNSAERKVSSHLVIDDDGAIYEVVRCWDGTVYRAWHAGKSFWQTEGKLWEGFNHFSIGIELVNLNGNIIPFPEPQYQALFEVVGHFQKLYPALQQAERVVGHEHIAGWRGKADPGILFDWAHFFEHCYPAQTMPDRRAICPAELKVALQKFLAVVPENPEKVSLFWQALSLMTETAVGLILQKKN